MDQERPAEDNEANREPLPFLDSVRVNGVFAAKELARFTRSELYVEELVFC